MPNLFEKLLSRAVLEMAIDLGTANTRIHVRGKGIILNEPTVIARQERGGAVVAVGKQAEYMFGRAPRSIITARPLEHGVISDFELTQELLTFFVNKVQRLSRKVPLRLLSHVLIGIPAGVTEVERKAVIDVGRAAGLRTVNVVEEPMAAAYGSDLRVDEADASLIMDIGAGTTEIAVISWGGIVVSKSVQVAGDEMDETLVAWMREKKNLLIGKQSAESIKRQVELFDQSSDEADILTIRGRDLSSGLPKEVTVEPQEVTMALKPPLTHLSEMVRDVIEDTPPELVADLVSKGLHLVGGGARLGGLDQFMANVLHIPVRKVDAPELAVVRGLAHILEHPDILQRTRMGWNN